MNDNDVSKFTRKECGGHNLIVTHAWNILAGSNSERWQEWGPLKDNHHWHYEFREKVEEDADNEIERGDFGDFEEDDSASEPEEYEIYGTENDQENEEFFVNCESCDREIEFGWSKPDRRVLFSPLNFQTSFPSKAGRIPSIWISGKGGNGSKRKISSRDQCSDAWLFTICTSPKWRREHSPTRGCGRGVFIIHLYG